MRARSTGRRRADAYPTDSKICIDTIIEAICIQPGPFFGTAGASLFDPNAYASYGNVDGNVENDGAFEVASRAEIPDAGFSENPPARAGGAA